MLREVIEVILSVNMGCIILDYIGHCNGFAVNILVSNDKIFSTGCGILFPAFLFRDILLLAH